MPTLDALQPVERDFARVPPVGVPCAGGLSYVRDGRHAGAVLGFPHLAGVLVGLRLLTRTEAANDGNGVYGSTRAAWTRLLILSMRWLCHSPWRRFDR